MKKLRNKETGVIGELQFHPDKEYCFTVETEARSNMRIYKTLEALAEKWEDYKEPKEYCYITGRGNFHFIEDIDDEGDKERKQIGNYFETEEEAEKAAEKLRAWKRLKDKGFEFYGWRKNPTGTYDFLARWKDIPPKMAEIINDLDLLCGGEE